MGSKVISVSLSESGIEKAIQELLAYKQEIIRKTELLRQKVAARLADEARSGFNGAIVDDLTGKNSPRLADVNVSIDDRDNVSVVVAEGEDAVWVEFGAGVYHNGSVGSSPHPKGAELGFTIGGYGKGNGKKEIWGFYEDGELRLTHGTPARMPMSQAMNTIINDIVSIAREVFG